jgi:5-methyltetrahydropteroyltriglutamate--homocysteine methyltransferase
MPSTSDRIQTTHAGSVGRPPRLQHLLLDKIAGKPVDAKEFEAASQEAVSEAVRRQVEAGITVVNDGDQSKTGFANYVTERLTGFDGPPEDRVLNLEQRQFPEWAGARRGQRRPCTGPITWKNFALAEQDIAHLKTALEGVEPAGVFMASVSPGTFTNHNPNRYYATNEEYLTAVADVMKREYDAIAAAGFIVQLDSPDLAARSNNYPDLSLEEWRTIVAQNVEAVAYATRDIPDEQVRVHVCWGGNAGPHNHDTKLSEIVDLLLKLPARYITIAAANGRHEFEWQVWQDVKLPDGKVLIPGVIDSTTNIIEHPATVAERIVRYANVLGRENVIAGVDCGFATFAGSPTVVPSITWAKLEALAEGARIASQRMW